MDLIAAPDGRKFQVSYDAGASGQVETGANTLSVRVGQRARIETEEEVWDSVHILCKEQPDGSLTVEVLICHPDWDEPQRVVSISSRPQDKDSVASSLKCHFEQPPFGGLRRASGAM